MSLHDRSIVEKPESHICSAQSDSVSSLQVDKRQKSRCYQSQFSINDQILVAVTRREIDKPIENTVIVEVDLSVGITEDIESSSRSKYQKPYHLDEMTKTDNWVKKMITYDVFDDKTVIKTIRDEAMEPNKLYLLKHKHKQETSEKLTKTFVDDLDIDRKNMRSTAAQFNPGDFRKPELVDKIIYPPENSNSVNVFLKSKNVLRNELIIHTGDIKRPLNLETSSKLSDNLSLQEIPKVLFDNDSLNDTNEDQYSYNPLHKDKNNDEVIEQVYEEKQRQSLRVEDIPFAEETDVSEHEPIEGSPTKISKSLQYFLPVFGAPLANCASSETLNFERCSNYSREDVTTDENESFNNTSERRKMTDFDELDSLSAASYEEFVSDSVKQSFPISDNKQTKPSSSSESPQQKEKEKYFRDSQKYLLDYDDWKDILDVRCQEDMVIHVNVHETPHIVYLDERPKVFKTVSESNFSFAQQRFEPIKTNIFITKPTKLKDFYNNIDIGFPIDSSKGAKETPNLYNEQEGPLEKEFLASESCMTPSNSVDEDSQIFSKSKSFSLKRKSDLIENSVVERNDQMLLSPSFDEIPQYSSCEFVIVNSNSDSNSFDANGSNQSQSFTNSVTSERKEKFLKSNFNSNINFFKPVSDTVSPPNSRNSTPSLTENTESIKKSELSSSHSSESSMIIKDVSSDDAYVFPKPQKNLGYDVLQEETEDESEKRSRNNTESEFSSIGTSDEEHFKNDCQASKESASNEGSSSDTETINELYTRDLITSPIEKSGEKYNQFLKDRALRMSQEESTKDKSSSSTDEDGISLTMETNENCSNDLNNNEIIDEESSYTEDTSSSSSDYSPIVNPILRQGESIEEIEKFLNLQNQDRIPLRRSSGFESHLNEVYHHENDEKNLLYNSERNRQSSSTSSSNDSYSDENPKEKKEIGKLLKRNELIIAPKPFTKQISVPISGHKDPYNSSSQSESTMSTSTTTEESNVVAEKPRTPNNVERGETNLKHEPLSKQFSVPIPKKRFSLSSQKDLPKESFTAPKKKIIEKNESESLYPMYINREEKVLNPENPKHLLSYSKSHKNQSDLVSESETSVTLSTTSRDTQPENENQTIDDTKGLQYRQNSITKDESKHIPEDEINNSSEDEDNTISFSSSTEELAPQRVTKENLQTRQRIDQPILSLYSTKVESDASGSRSSSYSLATSSDESKRITQPKSNDRSEDLIKSRSIPLFVSKKNKINSSLDKDKKGLSIDRREKFTKIGKTHIKSNFKRSESVPNYLEDSVSASTDSFYEDDNKIIPAKFSQSLKNISNVEEDEQLKKNRSHGYELISVTLKDNIITRFIEKRRKFVDQHFKNDILQAEIKSQDDKKNVLLSIDRREKFFMPKDFGKVSSMDNLKNDKSFASLPNAKSTSSGSSTSISTTSSRVSDKSDEEKMSLESLHSNSESHLSGEIQNREMNAVEPGTDEENQYYNGNRDLSESSDSISTTSSSSQDEDDKKAKNRPNDKINEPNKVIDRVEKFTDLDNPKKKIVSSKRNKAKDDSQKSFSSSSSRSSSSSSTTSKSSKVVENKSIDHKEKFTVPNSKSNIQGKKKKGKESSQSSSFSVSSSSSKTSSDKKEKDIQKKKSDSTDEDISFSLSSSTHEAPTTPIILNNKENEIFPENLVKESKIKVDDSDDSLGLRPEEKTNNKPKYDKSKINLPANYNTLPYKKPPNNIQIKEKSKSLDQPLTADQFMYKHPDVAGSMGDIVESRYHEFTETWSRQSPIDPKMLNKKETVPKSSKPQKPKIDHLYDSPKWKLPLTTRPRPVPSYLSPVNAFPWVPTDQEFGSVDSIISDYSKDYNDEEPLPKYKSLPEFLTSVATKHLPKETKIQKNVVKKPVLKTKIQPDYINLDYGIKESKPSSSAYDVRKKTSLTSVTTDSSYLDKPILREIPDNNFASFESLSSLTPQSSIVSKSLKNNKMKLPNQNSKIINQHVSSTSSSSDTDTEVAPKKIPPKVIPKFQSSYNQQNIDRKAHLIKANSLPSKRIPSTSESSEFSSTSEESSSSIHRF